MLLFLGALILGYILAGVATYAYAVLKSYEILGFWVFKMEDGYIGICKYPHWLMGWMYWLGVK